MINIKETKYPGYYISSCGKAFSIRSGFLTELKFGVSPDGYVRSHFSIKGKKNYVSMHRLVAESWIPNPENKPQVNHIDGNKLNNSTSNLEWVTLQENNLHCCRILGKRRGVTNSQSKFTEDQIRAIRQDNRTLHEIAKDYGCYFSTIHKIKKFETWQHVK